MRTIALTIRTWNEEAKGDRITNTISVMAKKRVIAYTMHEHEIAAAAQLMKSTARMEGSLVLGELDDTEIEQLRKQNVIVRVLNDPWQPTEPEPYEKVQGLKHVSAIGVFSPVDAATAKKLDYYAIQLSDPLITQMRSQLEQNGARLFDALAPNVYKVEAKAEDVDRINALSFVKGMRQFVTEVTNSEHRLQEELVPAGGTIGGMSEPVLYDIVLHQASDAPVVKQWLKDNDLDIVGDKGRKIRIQVSPENPEVARIGDLREVALVEEYVPPKLHNDRARELLRIESSNPGPLIPQTGDGQIIAVADTGIDDQHPDLQGRIVGIAALGRPGDHSDPHGHGTHVAGSVLGSGVRSNGKYKGAAPGAQLYFQSLLDRKGGLGGLPLDLEDLFEQAYQAGARIHNNSWGAATRSRYTINSSEVDGFVHRRKDMLIVISAGNEGTAAVRLNSATGFVDWLSIGSPASCKNALTVGASRSDRTQGGYSQFTYKQLWGQEFPDPPIADQKFSGDPEGLAAFSSRGPTDDRRIKPDVVAPGTDILSARSSIAPDANFHGGFPPDPDHYAYMGGTSMSAPLVAGCAALVREYLVKEAGHAEPSAALLKALLVNGTTELSGIDSVAHPVGRPNFHQGFGRINLLNTIPSPTRPDLKVFFTDNWQQPGTWFNRTGDRTRWQVQVTGPCPELRICMAYTDLPARGLQNNLDLFVELPGGAKLIGNQDLPMSLHIPDPDNNVEVVRIKDPVPGTYLIQVMASNLLAGDQDHALVVSGENISTINHYH
jgi:subtilisin family serine protease